MYRYKISETPSLEDTADKILSNIENGLYDEAYKIEEIINNLPDTPEKEYILERYERVESSIPDMPTMELKNLSNNLDVYIKSENLLSLSLDTNSIVFDDFSGVEDMKISNTIGVSVTSSLPYQLNAYLSSEIQNSDKSNIMDKQILNIKENSESIYQTFANTTNKIILKNDCIAGNDIKHNIDLLVKGGVAHEKDIYRATIKFEVHQL